MKLNYKLTIMHIYKPIATKCVTYTTFKNNE